MESNFEWITANGDIGIRFFHSIDDGPRHACQQRMRWKSKIAGGS